MKKIIFIAALFVAVWLPAASQVTKMELQASGLTCSMCSKAINKALLTLPFVKDTKSDIKNNRFIITLNDSVAVSPDAVRQKVEEAGFSVARLWMEMPFSGEEVKNDQHLQKGGFNFLFIHVPNQALNGTIRLQVIDKGFVTAKDFKKYSGLTAVKCYQTGVVGDCCTGINSATSNRIYHVTL